MIDLAQWRCVVGAWSARIVHRFSQSHSIKWQSNSSLHEYMLLSGLYLLVYSVAGNIRGVNHLLSVALVTTLLLLLCGDVERNPGPSNEFLRVFEKHLGVLIEAIPDPIKLANDMFSHGLVPDAIKNAVLTTNDSHYSKSSTLLNVFHGRLKTLDDTRAKEDLVTLCKAIEDLPITREILKDIGINEDMFFENIIITENSFIQMMKTKAFNQVISQPPEWMRSSISVDKKYYGRLMLLDTKKNSDRRQTAWHRTRGQLDRIPVADSSDKLIDINDILDDSKPGIVLIDGPPGIGKTTLCRKIRQMWVTGELKVKFKLALLISLRQREVVNATKLDELMQTAYKDDTIPSLCEHFHKNNGKGLLFIFDGWDEFPEESKQCSFVNEVITRNRLYYCTVIVTSRSYASESLLQLCHDEPIDRHVQILGFSVGEVHGFIKAAFKENEAESLISELELRTDIDSICCIPVVCFMLIFVYGKMKKLPHTMTELYTNFVLHTIKTEVSKQSNTGKYRFSSNNIKDIHNLPSPLNDCLDQLCLFSYNMLKAPNPTLVFDSFDSQSQLTLAEENTFLGLMTPFQYYDDDCYQFIHLTIQEYLAALWMSKQSDCHELFKEYLNSPHFHMALRFVAGLTKLDHPSYESFFSIPVNLKCRTMAIPMFAQRISSETKSNINCLYCRKFFSESGLHIPIKCSEYHLDMMNNDPFDGLYDELDLRLIHFLYESQNVHLCEKFALSISDRSICTCRYQLFAFDWYCFTYFLTRSRSVRWNHIHIRDALLFPLDVLSEKLQICNDNQEHEYICDCLTIDTQKRNLSTVLLFFQLFKCKVVNVSCCEDSLNDFFNGMKMIVQMPEIEEIHMIFDSGVYPIVAPDKLHIQTFCYEMSEIIAKSLTLKSIEIRFNLQSLSYSNVDELPIFILELIQVLLRNVKSNKHLQALSVVVHLSDGYINKMQEENCEVLIYLDYWNFIEQLIDSNTTLKTIQLILPPISEFFYEFQNVNFRSNNFSTMNVGIPYDSYTVFPITTISQLIQCSNLRYISFAHLIEDEIIDVVLHIPTFRNLQILDVNIIYDPNEAAYGKVEILKQLCQVMEHNQCVQALRVTTNTPICGTHGHECGVALKQLLQANQTLECLELYFPIPTNCLHYIRSGLQHNTTLKELAMVVYFSIGEDYLLNNEFFFNSNLKSMVVYLDPSQLCSQFEPRFPWIPCGEIILDPMSAYEVDLDQVFFSLYYHGIISCISSLLHQNGQLESLTVHLSHWQHPRIDELIRTNERLKEDAHLCLQPLWKVLRDHPSLKYISISGDIDFITDDIKRTVEAQGSPDLEIKNYPKIVIN